MTDTGFFKWVWRFNGVMIALGVTALSFLLLSELLPKRSVSARDVVNIDTEDQTIEETLVWGAISELPNGTFLMPLMTEQSYRTSGYSSSSKSTHGNELNLLIFDLDGTQEWLYPTQDQLILSRSAIQRPLAAPREDLDPVARLLQVVDTDTNKDNRLSHSDTRKLILTDANYGAPVELIADLPANAVIESETEQSLTLSVKHDGTVTLYTLDLAAKTLTEALELTPPSR